MKIILYCQHVWGVGHFFRTLEICRALSKHEIIMVTGGTSVSGTLPNHIREVRLPAIMTDSNYSRLYTTEKGKSLDQVLFERQSVRVWTIVRIAGSGSISCRNGILLLDDEFVSTITVDVKSSVDKSVSTDLDV